MNEIAVTSVKNISELAKKSEGKRFILDLWPCVLERTTPMRKHSTLVAGAIPILRFLYASEPIAYEWYP